MNWKFGGLFLGACFKIAMMSKLSIIQVFSKDPFMLRANNFGVMWLYSKCFLIFSVKATFSHNLEKTFHLLQPSCHHFLSFPTTSSLHYTVPLPFGLRSLQFFTSTKRFSISLQNMRWLWSQFTCVRTHSLSCQTSIFIPAICFEKHIEPDAFLHSHTDMTRFYEWHKEFHNCVSRYISILCRTSPVPLFSFTWTVHT